MRLVENKRNRIILPVFLKSSQPSLSSCFLMPFLSIASDCSPSQISALSLSLPQISTALHFLCPPSCPVSFVSQPLSLILSLFHFLPLRHIAQLLIQPLLLFSDVFFHRFLLLRLPSFHVCISINPSARFALWPFPLFSSSSLPFWQQHSWPLFCISLVLSLSPNTAWFHILPLPSHHLPFCPLPTSQSPTWQPCPINKTGTFLPWHPIAAPCLYMPVCPAKSQGHQSPQRMLLIRSNDHSLCQGDAHHLRQTNKIPFDASI